MDKDKVSGIYCIENIITNQKYIGQSINIKYRWKKHVSALNSNTHDNSYLQNSWNKYGKDNFKFYIIETCDQELLNEKEIYYIEYYNTLDRNYGYNLKTGGQNCSTYCTDEIKSKMSDAIKRSYENGDLKQRRSEATKQYWKNPDNKSRILNENNPMFGKHHTDESKKKMSEVKKSKHNIPYNKNLTKVFCEELNSEFENATQAAKELQIDSSSILKTCRGERHTCGGYHWHFVDNNLWENNIS